MHDNISVSAVSYLNTVPFLEGFRYAQAEGLALDIKVDSPSACARKLKEHRAQLGLVPVAAIPELKEKYKPVYRWGIGCDGPVGSVLIVSQVPLQRVKHIYPDYQSRTSNQLAAILIQDHFNLQPAWKAPLNGYESHIKDATAGVLIGDRALLMKDLFAYQYDLGQAWKDMTGLPFVFALWMASRGIDQGIVHHLDGFFSRAMIQRPELANRHADTFPGIDVNDYLSHRIKYDLSDERYGEALSLFWSKMGKQEPLIIE